MKFAEFPAAYSGWISNSSRFDGFTTTRTQAESGQPKVSSRAYVLENGRVAMSGSGQELLHDDRVRQAYLGL